MRKLLLLLILGCGPLVAEQVTITGTAEYGDGTPGTGSLQITYDQFLNENGDVIGGTISVPMGSGFIADPTTDTIFSPSHGKQDGDPIKFVTTSALPAPLDKDSTYFVITAAVDTFQVATLPGGTAVDITDAGTGDQYIVDGSISVQLWSNDASSYTVTYNFDIRDQRRTRFWNIPFGQGTALTIQDVEVGVPTNVTKIPVDQISTEGATAGQVVTAQSGSAGDASWENPGGGGAGVSSFNTRVGAVVSIAGDYAAFNAPWITPQTPVVTPLATDSILLQRTDDSWVRVEWSNLPSGGTTDHSALSNLDYASAGHTGFEPAIAASTSSLFWDGTKVFRQITVADVDSLQAELDARAKINGTPVAGNCARWFNAGTIEDAGSPCGSGGGAPADGPYWTKTPDPTLSNEFALSGLATGILKNTTVTGIPTIAVEGVDYEGPIPIGSPNEFWAWDKTFRTIDWSYLVGTQPAPIAHAASHETGGSDLLDLPAIPGQLTLDRVDVEATNGTPITTDVLNDWVLSAGQMSGGVITDGGSQTIDVAGGTGLIRSGPGDTDPLTTFEWSDSIGLSVPLGTSRYVYIEYNGGSPQVALDANSDRDYNANVFLGIVSNDQTEIKISNVPWRAGNGNGLTTDWVSGVFGTQRDRNIGGVNVSSNGIFVVRDAGALWVLKNLIPIPPLDTSGTDTFDSYYSDGAGGFTKITNVSEWPMDQYDDGSGTLANLLNNRYGTLWWSVDAGGNQSMLYGSSNANTVAAAQNENQPPAPDFIGKTAIFISRWVIQEGNSTPIVEESFFPELQAGVNLPHNSTTFRDAAAAHPAAAIDSPSLGTQRTLNDMQTDFDSAGTTGRGYIVDAGGGNINVAAGAGLIRTGAGDNTQLINFEWPATNGLTPTDNSASWVVARYNAGVPDVVVDALPPSDTDEILLGSVSRDGTEISISDTPWRMGDLDNRLLDWMGASGSLRDERIGGLIVYDNTTFVAMDSGRVISLLNPILIPAFDSSGTDRYTWWYRDGVGGWTAVGGQQTWPTDQYDDGSGTLANLSQNRYGTLWWRIDGSGTIHLVFGGIDTNDLATAQADEPPTDLPIPFEETTEWSSKWVIQEGTTSPNRVTSAWNQEGGGSTVTDHGALTGRSDPAQHPATSVTNTPTTDVPETDVQGAIDGLGVKVNKASLKSYGYAFGDPSGADLTAGDTQWGPFTISKACTMVSWASTVDAGTATFEVWRKSAGTDRPTPADTLNTTGVGVSTGTTVYSEILTDFSSVVFAVNDIVSINLSAATGAKLAQFQFECEVTP